MCSSAPALRFNCAIVDGLTGEPDRVHPKACLSGKASVSSKPKSSANRDDSDGLRAMQRLADLFNCHQLISLDQKGRRHV